MGHNALEERFRIIDSFLSQYTRPITILDIGASQGYYSLRVAEKFDCVAVMLEGDNRHYPMIGRQLSDICRANTSLSNIIHLNTPIIPDDLKMMSECEAFDVVLALNVIHWFGDTWQSLTNSILDMGDHILIETPPVEHGMTGKNAEIRDKIIHYLGNKGAKVIGYVKRHTSEIQSPFYLYSKPKKSIKRKTWLMPEGNADHIRIEGDFHSKTISKKLISEQITFIKNDWIPGINLITFLMCNGYFPLRAHLRKAIRSVSRAILFLL